MGNAIVFVPTQVTVMIGFALVTAIALNRDIRARGFFRGIFFFPVMLSPVVVAMTWVWLLQRDGALNGILGAFGFERVSWLTDPSRAFRWSVFVTVWAHMGFYMVILLAGLQSIPADIYEAAKMDRASPWRVFTRITLPLLKPVLLVVFILATIRSVQTFDEIYVLTGGGPGHGHQDDRALHLRDRLRGDAAQLRARGGGLAHAGRWCCSLFTALQMRLSRGRARWLSEPACASSRAGAAASAPTGPTGSRTATSVLGVVVMLVAGALGGALVVQERGQPARSSRPRCWPEAIESGEGRGLRRGRCRSSG